MTIKKLDVNEKSERCNYLSFDLNLIGNVFFIPFNDSNILIYISKILMQIKFGHY